MEPQSSVFKNLEYSRSKNNNNQSQIVTVVVRDDNHLRHTESTARTIQDNVPDAPAQGALPAVVHVRLRRVLDQGDEQFNVGAKVEEVDPEQDVAESHAETDAEEETEDRDEDLAASGHGLVAALVHRALDDGDGTGEDRVQREDDIVQLDRVHACWVAVEVFGLEEVILGHLPIFASYFLLSFHTYLDGFDPQETDVKDTVQKEPDNVQTQEVKV